MNRLISDVYYRSGLWLLFCSVLGAFVAGCGCSPYTDPCCCQWLEYRADISLELSDLVSAGYDVSESPEVEITVRLDVPEDSEDLYTFVVLESFGEQMEYGNYEMSVVVDLERSCMYDGEITHRLILPQSWPGEAVATFHTTEIVLDTTSAESEWIEEPPIYLSSHLDTRCSMQQDG